ncbi:MAG: Rrf2 family transcriptional regulator [Elusimicrobiales bacterium]
MALLSRETDYAVRALAVLAGAGEGKHVSSSEISRVQRIPLSFLRRILGGLLRAGLIEAREGRNGGVRLARKPETISIASVMEIFQGPVSLSRCIFRRRLCRNGGTCVLRREIADIESYAARKLAGLTVADLLRIQRRKS